MTDLIVNGDIFGTVRQRANNLNDMIQIAETSAAVTAGTITSIPIYSLPKTILYTGEKVTLIDRDTMTVTELTLDANMTASDTALTITSTVFAGDIAANSAIYYKYTDLLALIFPLI